MELIYLVICVFGLVDMVNYNFKFKLEIFVGINFGLIFELLFGYIVMVDYWNIKCKNIIGLVSM